MGTIHGEFLLFISVTNTNLHSSTSVLDQNKATCWSKLDALGDLTHAGLGTGIYILEKLILLNSDDR